MADKKVSAREVFDGSPFSPYQVWVCFLCFCVTLLDGFDLTVIGVTLPKIRESLNASPSAIGLAVGAGQLGPLVGAIVLGMIADRVGRKRMLCISALIFGVFTWMTAYITSVEQLAIMRLIAGIGLGGAVPNALAFGCEYAPSRARATLTTMMYAGMAVGSIIGGLSGAFLMPVYGWQSLFIVGGITPIGIAILIAILLPESLEFLVRQGLDNVRIRAIVSKINPSLGGDKDVQFYSSEEKLPGIPVKHLFTGGRAFTTVLLWILFFLSFFLLWFLLTWATTLLRKSGASVQQFSIAFACINFGSFLATITIGRLMDKFNPFRTLIFAFIVAFISVVVFGFTAGSDFIVVAIISVLTGFFVIGGNSGLMALCTISYPLDIRASGLGWAYAVGKVGSLLAPVTGGFLQGLDWSVPKICIAHAVAALLVAVCVVILQRHVAAASSPKGV